jgi:hypothetical protein
MATNRWRGDAAPVAQVSAVTVTADDNTTTYKITINGKVVSVVGSGAGVNTTAANLKAQLIASTIPEFLEVTWTVVAATISGTAIVAGKPFTFTATVSGGAGSFGAVSTPTASSGPNDWSVAGNWTTNAIPANADDTYIDVPIPIYYGLDQHTVALNSLTLGPTFTPALGLKLLTKGPIAVPVNTAFTDIATGGTLNFNTTYYYRVSALDGIGETFASTETSKATANDANATHQITVNWGAVTGASGYRIYGRSTGAEQLLATVGNVTTWTDTGSIVPAGSLPTSNTTLSADYDEYRGVNLQIQATTITCNSPSNHIRLDTGSTSNTTLIVNQTGTLATEANTEPLRWRGAGTGAGNTVDIQGGIVGIARVAGDTAVCATLNVGPGAIVTAGNSSSVAAGSGLTLTAVNVQQGGVLATYNNIVTVTIDGGTLNHYTGTVTTANVNFGTMVYRSAGTITTLVVGPTAVVDFNQDLRARTVTNSTLYGQKSAGDTQLATIHDKFNTVTWSNAPTRLPAANFPGPSNP